MDAAYALLIEEYTRVGISLLEAVEQTAGMRAGGESPKPETGMSEEELARQNQRAMRELQQQMGGL